MWCSFFKSYKPYSALEEGLGVHKVERICDMEKIDVLVIGAGVVGLAIARTMAKEGRQVIVAEAEKLPGSITTSRNSGVVHAGIYYPKNSLKARMCVRGKKMLHEYAREKGIEFKNCGKLIVACTQQEVSKLKEIQLKARANGVNDLEILMPEEVKEMEPEVQSFGGLLSPSTGIVDVHALVEEFIKDIESHDGVVAYDNRIERIERKSDYFLIQIESGDKVLAKTLINAAGLQAQKIAHKISGLDRATIPQQFLAKGHYFGISGKAPFSRLVYPVPVKGGLGIHFTFNIAGESLFGPDVEWIEQGSEYSYDVDPSRATKFAEAIQRYWPGIMNRQLSPAYAGVRPKVSGPNDPDGDFVLHDHKVHGINNLVNLYGIESPGLTSSLAIGESVSRSLTKRAVLS